MTKTNQTVLSAVAFSLVLLAAWSVFSPSDDSPAYQAHAPGAERQALSGTAALLADATAEQSGANRHSAGSNGDGQAVFGKAGDGLGAAAPPGASATAATGLERSRSVADETRADEPAGQWAIAGLVQDESGNPLGDIEVAAELIQPGADGLETGSEPAEGLTTWSGVDGLFLFENLADGEYRLRAVPDDRFAPAETKARVGVMSANLVLVRQRSVRLFGVVSSQSGEELEAVRVVAGPPTRVTESDGDGGYEMDISVKGRNRPATVHFRKEGYRDQSIRLDPAELDETLDYFELDVSMEPLEGLTAVTGRLTDSDGQPVAGTIVNMRSPRLGNSYRAQSGPSGHFTVKGVEPGPDYQISIRPGAGFRDYQRSMEIPASGLQLEIVLDSLDQGEVAGLMTDMDGRPISGFAMTLRSHSAAGHSVQVVSDSMGYFSVPEFPTGNALLKTNSYPVFETRGFDVSSEDVEPVWVVLDIGPGTLFGRVESELGESVAASEVSLSWQFQEDGVQNFSVRKTTADQNGNFVFTGLGPGEHTLRVNAPGFRMATVNVDTGMSPDNLIVQLEEEG